MSPPNKGRRSINFLKKRLGRWQRLRLDLEDKIKQQCADDSIILTEADWRRWKKKRSAIRTMLGKLQSQLTRALQARERMEKYNAEAKQRARDYAAKTRSTDQPAEAPSSQHVAPADTETSKPD